MPGKCSDRHDSNIGSWHYHLRSFSISACCLLYSASCLSVAFPGLGIPDFMPDLPIGLQPISVHIVEHGDMAVRIIANVEYPTDVDDDSGDGIALARVTVHDQGSMFI